MLDAVLTASRLEPLGREAGAAVGEQVGEVEREGPQSLLQKGNSALLRLVILDRQMGRARAAVDGDEQVALAVRSLGRCLTSICTKPRS
jgi:hypothetical protein